MRDLIKKVLREESESMDLMHFWSNSPKVTDADNTEQMDDFMWHIINYVNFPSDGNYRRIKTFIKSLIRYGLIDVEFYTNMYRWLNRKLRDISIAEEEFQLSLDSIIALIPIALLGFIITLNISKLKPSIQHNRYLALSALHLLLYGIFWTYIFCSLAPLPLNP